MIIKLDLLQFSLDKSNATEGYSRSFASTPYYRQYFSKKYAAGFFVEGFGMLNSGIEDYYYNDRIDSSSMGAFDYTDFALGISIGGKFIAKRGFVAEIYSRIGPNIVESDNGPEIVGRGDIALRYRF
ncbi:MAG: hypothetical protein COA50_09360 [Flavobacteriaceae bacterium]|nr:MAG: hypothetical protein COA50_09360 [Flavobacteriaceae bacterium]